MIPVKIGALAYVIVPVRNLEKATKVYSNLLGIGPPPEPHPYSKQLTMDKPGFKLRIQLLKMPNDCWLELVEPVEGPRVELLQNNGEGAVYMLGFRVDNIEKAYDELKSIGITPVDSMNVPMIDKKYDMGLCGEKAFNLPPEKTGGTRIEVVETHF